MKLSSILAIVIGVALLVIVKAATYTVGEHEQVIVTRFGKLQGYVAEPGLSWKTPFVDSIHRFDKRWLEWDGAPNQIPTRDKKYIWVDTYARWKIADPVKFYQVLRDEPSARSRLDDIIDGEIRNAIANVALIEIVRSSNREFEIGAEVDEAGFDPAEFKVTLGRDKLQEIVLSKAKPVVADYGIELADIRVKRVNYVESVQAKVFERMVSERHRIAERYRSEGMGKSAEIRGKRERELKVVESEAFRKAEEVRGRADAEAAAIYAAAYNRDPALYQFLKTLETYRKTIDKNTTLVLSTDADVLRLLKSDSN
jgi:modulator of FtsH protease HflC